jgi:ABC-type uncharacterized transport system permease subunit
MSSQTAPGPALIDPALAPPRPVRRTRLRTAVIYGLAALVLLAMVEAYTGASELTSRGTAGAALRLAIPILMAGMGGLFAERAGVVNIGLEGMMIAGTWFGAWGSWQFGPWWGVVLGLAGGAFFGLVHALATVTFTVDHIVSGVAINILAAGSMRFLSSITYTPETGGSVVQSPTVAKIGNFNTPFLAGGEILGWRTPDLLGWLERKQWFFLSDVAGLARGITGDVSWLTFAALLLVPLSIWALWRTAWGLRLRSCGEDPHAAESLGVPVLRMKYYAVAISGALAGIGGTFIVLVQQGLYREASTAGRGFIGLGAMIFGNWLPLGVLRGSFLFGFGDSLRFRGPNTVRALLLWLGVGLILLALLQLRRKHLRGAVTQGAIAFVFIAGFALLTEIPDQLITAIPYLITLLVLAVATQRLRMPAADGMRYRKGEGA